MSRKRKPVIMPIADATEALVWRAKFLLEAIDDKIAVPEHAKRLEHALDDYAESKRWSILAPSTAVQPLSVIYTCEGCDGPCTERTDGLCNRCYDNAHPEPVSGTLSFAEMQS